MPETTCPGPLIVTSTLGGDPGAALALAAIALTEPGLAAVITSEEGRDLRRARFAAYLLELLGRSDVRVLPGICQDSHRYRPPTSRYWAANALTPDNLEIPAPDPRAAYDAIAGLRRAHPGTVIRVLNTAPMTDLAHLLALDRDAATPLDLRSKLEIWHSGGGFGDRPRIRFRLDRSATDSVLSTARQVRIVLAESCDRLPRLDRDGDVARALTGSPHRWAELLAAHLDQWWRIAAPTTTHLADVATASAALGHRFIDFANTSVIADDPVRPTDDTERYLVPTSTGIDAHRMRTWLLDTITGDGGRRLVGTGATSARTR
ncbi:hypothetical protein ACTD5D_09795 [Nocardia takedensis]|uniref:hypothetical protein n=1 Tax=Nocardia takedensis TaxID=259390 RepID=UPI003F761CE2